MTIYKCEPGQTCQFHYGIPKSSLQNGWGRDDSICYGRLVLAGLVCHAYYFIPGTLWAYSHLCAVKKHQIKSNPVRCVCTHRYNSCIYILFQSIPIISRPILILKTTKKKKTTTKTQLYCDCTIYPIIAQR